MSGGGGSSSPDGSTVSHRGRRNLRRRQIRLLRSHRTLFTALIVAASLSRDSNEVRPGRATCGLTRGPTSILWRFASPCRRARGVHVGRPAERACATDATGRHWAPRSALGDAGDESYESELSYVAGRVAVGEVLVAEVAGRVVGCVSLGHGATSLSEVDDSSAATIRMLGVSSKARGQGIGEALIRTCIERAREAGNRRVRSIPAPR